MPVNEKNEILKNNLTNKENLANIEINNNNYSITGDITETLENLDNITNNNNNNNNTFLSANNMNSNNINKDNYIQNQLIFLN